MKTVLINLESDPVLEAQLCDELEAKRGEIELRRFPDEETYLRVLTDCKDRNVVILCNLYQPDNKILRLLLLATTLREMGALKVGLITPYLAYMRQDKQFHDGECVSSRPFARLISEHLDFLVTVDPHLHRYHRLDEIYTIPATVVHAAPLIANWINEHIQNPLLIGPDSESEQWVSQVAELAGAPFQVLSKTRRGDYDVEVTLPDVERWLNHTPVLVDDIISSGRTMLETVDHLKQAGMPKATCIAVHGIFAGDAYTQLESVANVVTSRCIVHPSSMIEIAPAIAVATKQLLNQ
ncbi:ribose-phosphate diphosphokinase [Amphritea balenae]|uniref:ribose-phosphate diphosphokinase n=1 Tax=Amphritea balenae TaxID=452629 RepID=A0A3P1SPS9_9GAMM|nr:ribose-phosphate diphosphokinase [Amphritea balenae]RRC98222.1 ribose-phosphate diphosphokinase [Amphritea balenae]GGK80226.1 phosphoribosylpyrophosphate synthetase [Amphritea balenae]